MARAREHPYIWATWLARLLAGEAHCEWAGWFRAHYQDWTKPTSDFDSARWMMDHTALVNEARTSREKLGYEVFTEEQNFFTLRGKAATLAGKPDLIAVKGNDLVIVDAKTGKPSPAPQRPSPDLYVRRPQGHTGIQGNGIPGPRHLPGRQCPDPGIRAGPAVHRPTWRPDPAAGGREPGEKGTQRLRVPVVRHHQGGLPGAG